MAVQGTDVTLWDDEKVRQFLQLLKGPVQLILRQPVPRHKEIANIRFDKCGNARKLRDLGLSLHLVLKVKPGSKAAEVGFHESDEITEVLLECFCKHVFFDTKLMYVFMYVCMRSMHLSLSSVTLG